MTAPFSIIGRVAGFLTLLTGQMMAASLAPTPTAAEFDQATRWVNAKFEPAPAPGPGIEVLANHDPVQLNSRNGQPLSLAGVAYRRGLYCHAHSQLVVRLPGPGSEFSAVVGVDSNADTSNGRGSVHFAVLVAGQEQFKSGVLTEGMAGVPVTVDLHGARELVLQVDDAGDGISCDQADWADARVKLQDGREIWLADLGLVAPEFDATPPFSFVYGGKPSRELLPAWPVERASRMRDDQRREYEVIYRDPATGLQVRCVAVQYQDFPTVEWTVYFKNLGATDTPVLNDVRALDAVLAPVSAGNPVLHHAAGTTVAASDFEPRSTPLEPQQALTLAAQDGRPCSGVWPYFNLETGADRGVIMVVGWPGQWQAGFARDTITGLRVTAGQKTTHFKLKPGEEVRTPLLVLQFWEGDWIRAQNIWRRWMVAHNLPRPGGAPPRPWLTPCSSHQFGEMIRANEQNQEEFIQRYQDEGFAIDYWWMDAGWYVNASGWPNVGTWRVDPNRFPHGLRAVTDYGHARGVKSIVWFEPERVTPGTWLYEQHPEWLLGPEGGTKLLDLGNPEARTWLTDYVDHFLTKQGIDLYRQDYNIDPLPFWQAADAPDRQGITENHYVSGYLAYWDALRQRHPDLVIDSCASGGFRNDLETIRRSLPFLRSDHIFDAVGNQCMSYGLAFWLPYNGTGTGPNQFSRYELRSNLSCPKITPCWDVRDPNLPYDLLRKVVTDWRGYADNYVRGDFYPLTPYSRDGGVWLAWQFNQPEAGRGVVQGFRRADSPYEALRARLQGLDPHGRYRLTNLDEPASTEEKTGSELMNEGLPLRLAETPGAVVVTYQKL